MSVRARIPAVLAPAVALLVLLTAAIPARADQAYERVAAAYAQGGGHLNPCAFTTAQLEAALRGIPPALRTTVPALRTAMESGIAAHKRGDCKGVKPEEGTTGGAAVPESAPPPVTTAPAPAATSPAATAPTTPVAPATTAPAPAQQQQPARASGGHDRKPLIVALIAAGALVLLALLLWAFARSRGWDPAWNARMRHAWGEAGFRTTSTWAEFTDWLRLGR
jgi:hypothetical protein